MSKKIYNSWNGDQQLKNKVVALIELDKAQEKIVQNFGYWSEEDQKGCNIGCGEYAVCQATGDKFTDRRHEYLSLKLDIPASIFYLADGIFEGLPKEKSSKVVVDFWRELPVGKDLSNISILMQIKSMEMCRDNAFDDGKDAIDAVIYLKNKELNGEIIPDETWSAAEAAARSAAEAAARSAARAAARSAESAARSATWSAALSAALSAESAARSAEAAEAARAAAWSAAYIDLSEYFLEILNNK